MKLFYEKQTWGTLRDFLRARRIKDPNLNRKGMPGLTMLLLVADRERVFQFLDLPAELRVEVYKHSVVARRFVTSLQRRGWHSREVRTARSLMRVSHQIHDEIKPIFYGLNFFLVRPPRAAYLSHPSSKRSYDFIQRLALDVHAYLDPYIAGMTRFKPPSGIRQIMFTYRCEPKYYPKSLGGRWTGFQEVSARPLIKTLLEESKSNGLEVMLVDEWCKDIQTLQELGTQIMGPARM